MPDQIIAIEEHFTSPALLAKLGNTKAGPIMSGLTNLGAARIKDMDDAGIDLAVLSENNPAAQNFEPDVAIAVARASNDFLHETIRANPTRFAGFAALPTPAPKEAADELERSVTKLGFKGAMIMGTTNGSFIDEKQFRPIFERAAKLDVPVYIHPSPVNPIVIAQYFKGHPFFAGSPLGFGLETLTHTFRLITSGLFDEFPSLKIIVGHLGEAAPFTLWRTDHNLSKVLKLPKSFIDYYKMHFWLTTSGAFSDSALACAMAEMGVERIMFAVYWPYIDNTLGTKWLKAAPVSDSDRALIFSGNAKKLLKL
jgi:predicted TIM-barrel fold metal-dependent hydrolase